MLKKTGFFCVFLLVIKVIRDALHSDHGRMAHLVFLYPVNSGCRTPKKPEIKPDMLHNAHCTRLILYTLYNVLRSDKLPLEYANLKFFILKKKKVKSVFLEAGFLASLHHNKT